MTTRLHIDKLGLGLVAGLAAGSLIACEENPSLNTGAEPKVEFRTTSADENSAPQPALDSSSSAGVPLPIEPIVVETRPEATDAAQTGANATMSVQPTTEASLVSTSR